MKHFTRTYVTSTLKRFKLKIFVYSIKGGCYSSAEVLTITSRDLRRDGMKGTAPTAILPRADYTVLWGGSSLILEPYAACLFGV